jgi:hypothetical protein
MTYNWELWDAFEGAAEDLGLELHSKDGGCVYMEVPEDIRQKFYVMCWTPLNKLQSVVKDYREDSILGTWQMRLRDLRQNHSDFHLEFGAKDYQNGSMFWFPGMFNKATKQQIIDAVKIMMDRDNFEKYRLMAIIRQESAE